jgi:hypothetical protein
MDNALAPPKHANAVDAFASDLARLDSENAHAVTEAARELIQAAWLRQEIEKGRKSGDPLDGDEVFAELLTEAEADIGRTS